MQKKILTLFVRDGKTKKGKERQITVPNLAFKATLTKIACAETENHLEQTQVAGRPSVIDFVDNYLTWNLYRDYRPLNCQFLSLCSADHSQEDHQRI